MLTLTKLLQATKSIINPRIAASCQIHSSSTVQASLEEKLGLPPRPKKPLTPFFRYLTENRNKLQQQNPNLKPIEVVKLCAKNYATVDPNIKSKYQDEYTKEQEDYIRRRTVYDNKLTEEQKYEIANAKQEAVDKKARIEYRKKLRENDKPKKPLSGFLRYLKEARVKNPCDPSQRYREWQQKIADKWNKMSDAERKPYNDASHAEFAKYKQDIAKWELKMVRLGNIDLVREEALIEHENSQKPKRRQSKKQLSSDSDWELGWYSSSQSSPASSSNDIIITNLDTNSPPSQTINHQQATPLAADKIDDSPKNGIDVKMSDGEKENTTSEPHRDIMSKDQVPESDEKSKKVIDKLKNFFKFWSSIDRPHPMCHTHTNK